MGKFRRRSAGGVRDEARLSRLSGVAAAERKRWASAAGLLQLPGEFRNRMLASPLLSSMSLNFIAAGASAS